jgi:hypothetical protein
MYVGNIFYNKQQNYGMVCLNKGDSSTVAFHLSGSEFRCYSIVLIFEVLYRT